MLSLPPRPQASARGRRISVPAPLDVVHPAGTPRGANPGTPGTPRDAATPDSGGAPRRGSGGTAPQYGAAQTPRGGMASDVGGRVEGGGGRLAPRPPLRLTKSEQFLPSGEWDEGGGGGRGERREGRGGEGRGRAPGFWSAGDEVTYLHRNGGESVAKVPPPPRPPRLQGTSLSEGRPPR